MISKVIKQPQQREHKGGHQQTGLRHVSEAVLRKPASSYTGRRLQHRKEPVSLIKPSRGPGLRDAGRKGSRRET